MKCDLGELESVRAFAREFEAKHGGQLDVLVNNGEGRRFVSSTEPRPDDRHMSAYSADCLRLCVSSAAWLSLSLSLLIYLALLGSTYVSVHVE